MLSLSTEASPQLSLAELDAGCRARGLDGQELVIAAGEAPDAVVARARAAGGRIVALRIATLDARTAPGIARAAATLGVPVSLPAGAIEPAQCAAVAAAFERERSRLLLGCSTNLDESLALLVELRRYGSPASLGLAWEIEPSTFDLGEASAILLAAREVLGVVRLHGGGPEQRDHDGRGVGSLFVELALSGFAGPIVLCPSSPENVPRWTQWLHARGTTACGHAVSTKDIELDVCEVEPRNRLETILGAYRMLIPGNTLHLTVDHDPVCMQYMLEATEPANSFAFQVVEHGPEIWRADVTKQ